MTDLSWIGQLWAYVLMGDKANGRRNSRADVRFFACGWAGADLVIFFEEGFLLRDDSAGCHGV